MLWMCRESVTYRYWAPARARGAAWPFVRVSPEGLHGRAHVTDRHWGNARTGVLMKASV